MDIHACSRSGEADSANNKYYLCITQELAEITKLPEQQSFRRQFLDTLSVWISTVNTPLMQRYSEIEFELSEFVLFNQKKSKALGFLIKFRNPGEKMDFVKIITGERRGGAWDFYLKGNWSIAMQRPPSHPDYGKRLSRTYMEERVLRLISSDGYYKGKSCERDYEYFEKQWFPEYRKDENIREN
jgi:hypothetical protein